MANQITIEVVGRDGGAKQTITATSREADKLGGSVKRVGEIAQGIIAAQMFERIGQSASRFLGKARDASSNLGESVNAVGVVFGQESRAVLAWGRDNAAAFGLSERAFNQAITPMAAGLKNAGLSMDQVSTSTIDLTTRAADMASVFNTDVEEALLAIQAGLRGEADPLERFGVSLTAAAVEARALADSGKESAAALTLQEKAAARVAIILEQTEAVAGDFANTSDSLANSQRILAAEMENAQAITGNLMLPALQALNSLLIPLVQAFNDAPKPIQVVVGSLVLLGAGILTVTSRIAPMVISMNAAGISAGTLATKARAAALSVTSMGIAIAAAGVGIIAWGTSARHTSENISGLTEDVERFVRTGEQTASLRKHFGEGAEGVEEFADKLDVATAGFFNWSDSLNRSFDEISQAKSAFKDLDTAMADLVDQGHNADEILQRLIDTYDLSEEQVEQLRAVLPKYTEAAQRATERTSDLGGAHADAAGSARDEMVALEDLEDALKAQADPMFALIKAQQNLKDKQDAYTDAVEEFGRKSPEAEDALLALAEAGVDVASASSRAGGAFDGKLTPAMRAALKAAGLTERQIKDIERAADRARRDLERFEGSYRADVRVHTRYTSAGTPPGPGASPSIFFNAHGGNVGGIGARGMQTGGISGGALGLVGEQGPELVRLPFGSTVIPSGQSAAMLRATRETLGALRSGRSFFEDFSFRGNSSNVGRFNDQFAEWFYGGGGRFSRGGVTSFLKKLEDQLEQLERRRATPVRRAVSPAAAPSAGSRDGVVSVELIIRGDGTRRAEQTVADVREGLRVNATFRREVAAVAVRA